LPDALRSGVAAYRGSRRRSEVVGQVAGVTIVDDYGHHPTAIRATLAGYRTFYPNRRIIVDFMSHTYTRTAAFLSEFGTSFSAADIVILNRIYGSAREAEDAQVTGEDLAAAVAKNHPTVWYEPEFEGAAKRALQVLRPGDLFITMGAGDNFRVGEIVKSALEGRSYD
jgi:UDP-N-acetylmuramate--alanine ligase